MSKQSARHQAHRTKAPQRRLPPAEREHLIVDEALRFFAEFGFHGQTRHLARRLGITQPLLFRYFPSKDALIDRVYEKGYLSRWDPEWDRLLADRRLPLRERLVTFYRDYARMIDRYEWIRMFMHAALRGEALVQRHMTRMRERVVSRIAIELRAELGLADPATRPLGEAEIELVYGLHAGLLYLLIRRWIYQSSGKGPIDEIVTVNVETFLAGAAVTLPRLLASSPAEREAAAPHPR